MSGSDKHSRRLSLELEYLKKDTEANPDPDVFAELVEDNLQHWIGRIKGPVGTPFETGYFFIDIHIPNDYPYAPPKMNFDTKVWHPNISSQTGAICLDILKTEWSPALTVRTALLSVEALLSSPEPLDPQDAQVAAMYLSDREGYEMKAREWVMAYAQDKTLPYEKKVKTLTDMGIPASSALKSLKSHNWDVNAAANECFADM